MKVFCQSSNEVLQINENNDLLSEGGEGYIFKVGNSSKYVAKIYKDPGRKSFDKIVAMLKNPPNDGITPGHTLFAWPKDLLKSDNSSGKLIGFVMPKITKAGGFIDVSSPFLRQKEHPNFTFRDLLTIGSNIVKAFSALHEKGYVIGDVNECNILVTGSGLISFVDTDSFQVPDNDKKRVYRCPVYRPEFTPPELHGKDLNQTNRKIEHDLFGMGILLFQLFDYFTVEGGLIFWCSCALVLFRAASDPPPADIAT